MDQLHSIPWVGILTSLALGVIASIAASTVFLAAMLRFKPSIAISSHIAQTIINDKKEYQIKVINRAPRSAVNLRAELEMEISSNVPRGQVFDYKDIPLTKNAILELSRFSRTDSDTLYAYRFCIREDINQKWDEETKQRLTFRLHATDSVSGFGRMFKKTYFHKKTDIKKDDFEFGNSMEVV